MKYPLFNLYEAQNIDTFWYLSSPYSRYEEGMDKAYEAVRLITGGLIKSGVRVYSPILHSHPLNIEGIDPLDAEFWLNNQQGMMKSSHGMIVATMKGWDKSFGVNYELEFFEKQEKPIRMLCSSIGISSDLLENLQLGTFKREKLDDEQIEALTLLWKKEEDSVNGK